MKCPFTVSCCIYAILWILSSLFSNSRRKVHFRLVFTMMRTDKHGSNLFLVPLSFKNTNKMYNIIKKKEDNINKNEALKQ